MHSLLRTLSLPLLAVGLTLVLGSCSGGEEPQPPNPPNPCEGVVCGPGSCVATGGVAACQCQPGHHAEGLTCVKDDGPPLNPCQPNPCMQPGRTQCSNVNGAPVCSCDPGRVDVGGQCLVPNSCQPNPCTEPNKTVCEVSSGQVTCSCVPGYVPDGNGCKPDPGASCANQHTTGDAFEPDECPALARAFGTTGGQNEQHTLVPATDEDWFRISVQAGRIYEITAAGAVFVRLSVALYAADGTTVLASDHTGQRNVVLVRKVETSGDVFLRVRAFSSSSAGAYGLSVLDRGADDFADEPAQATALTAPNGTPVPGAFQFDGDRDVVKVPLAAGRSYRFNAAWATSSTSSLRLELIAPDRTTVVLSSESTAPLTTTRITSAGDYYLRLVDPTGKLRANYTFTVTDFGVDDHGDSPGESSPVVIGGPATPGSTEHAADADVFSFQAQVGHIYAFTCNPSGGATDCLVSLSNSSGSVLATDNNGGTGYIVREYSSAGTYYFRVSTNAAGNYTYRLEDLGFDDHGDFRSDAVLQTEGPTPNNALLETPGDVDYLKFNVQAQRVYTFTCTSSAFTCDAELISSTGAVLKSGRATSGTVTLRHTFTSAGTAYVGISASTSTATGAYTWKWESEVADDHGDTTGTATAITPGGAPTGFLEEVGDVDVFRFTATAGRIYRFTCDRSAYDCDVELLDSTGAVVVSATGPEQVAVIAREYTVGGTYYFRVQTDSGATGQYGYSLEDLGPDDHGDTSATATALSAGASGNGRLELAGDVDAFSFSGLVNEVHEFTCTGTTVDCNVVLLDANGVAVASDTGTNTSAKVSYRLTQSGTWYLHVSSTALATGSYSYQLVNQGSDEHGNTTGTATPVVVGAPQDSGRIDTPFDADFFVFEALAGHIYEITCTSSPNCALELLNSQGSVIGSSIAPTAQLKRKLSTAGPYYFRITRIPATTGTYTYRIVDLGLDDHGDDLASATALTPGAPVATGKLELAGDVDVFSFSAQAGFLYEFTCGSTAIDCNLELLNSQGTVVASDTGSSTSALVRRQLTTAGTYYFRVSGGSSGSATGTYNYQLQSFGQDDHGNTPGSATPVVAGSPAANAFLEVATDVDVFSFSATANHIYQFTCLATLDCNVTLTDGAGTVLAQDVSSSANATVAYEFGTAGTYYFHVSSGNGGTGSYTYELQDLGLDDHGDTRATATAITASTTSSTGRVETLGDQDFFSFAGEASTVYEFSCSSSAMDCDLQLYDSTGTVLLSDTDSSSSAKVTYLVRTAATFYVRVYSGTATRGDYTYQLKDLGTDDHGNTPATATPVTPAPAPVNARINSAADVDYFSFTSEAGHIYELECTSAAIDCNLVLTDASGTTVASDTASASRALIRVELAQAGTYYFRIFPGSASFGDYAYALRDLGVDDHGDSRAFATPIAPMASSAPGQIETSGDEDVFSFSGTAGRIYEFSCTLSAGDCDLDLVDSTGALLAQDVAPSSSARVVYELGAAGTYYVRLRFGNASTTVIGGYSYQLKDLGTDDHGDTLATATAITTSTTSSTGRAETLGDLDFFSFAGTVNTTYEFSCSSSSIDCNAVLYDGNGTVLLSDTGTSSSAKVTYVVRAAGTFYVRVSSGTATLGDYTYQLKNLGTDDHGNTPANATPVTPIDSYFNARIDAAGDVDVFSFTAVANHIYEINCSTSNFDCDIVLMDAAGTTIASDTGSFTSAQVKVELSTAGTYYVRYLSGNTNFGAYSYRIRDMGLDDHGDTQATATPVVPTTGTTLTSAQLEVSGDADWLSFTAETGHVYEVTCSTSNFDCNVGLYNAAGTLVTSDTGSTNSALVRAELNTAGTYSVRIYSGTVSYGTYSYRIRDLGFDDHGDTQATATPVVPTTTTTLTPASLEVIGDVDWLSFTAEAGHVYEVYC
ncbi:MAG TPA: pre-peptidase C-terminal domain-containing protein, partial [Myxococcaceae bacterium]